jgi:hypothetical protein
MSKISITKRRLCALLAVFALTVAAVGGTAGAAQASKGDNNGAYVIHNFLGSGCNVIFNHGAGIVISCESD